MTTTFEVILEERHEEAVKERKKKILAIILTLLVYGLIFLIMFFFKVGRADPPFPKESEVEVTIMPPAEMVEAVTFTEEIAGGNSLGENSNTNPGGGNAMQGDNGANGEQSNTENTSAKSETGNDPDGANVKPNDQNASNASDNQTTTTTKPNKKKPGFENKNGTHSTGNGNDEGPNNGNGTDPGNGSKPGIGTGHGNGPGDGNFEGEDGTTRRLINKPSCSDNSDKTGTIRLKVFLDRDGNVTFTESTRGGTISDLTVINAYRICFERYAKYEPSKTGATKQLGFITITIVN